MSKAILPVLGLAAATMLASTAQAGTSVHVQIGAPSVVVAHPAPVVVYPAPVVVQPAPVVVQPVPVYRTYGHLYAAPAGYPHHPYRRGGDQDRDGIPDRFDHDRDGDGVRNRFDRRPQNPWRY